MSRNLHAMEVRRATPRCRRLLIEVGDWYRQLQSCAVFDDPEYVDFVRSEYQYAKEKLAKEMTK